MPLTRKNVKDPDSPFLTAKAVGAGVRFRERYPAAEFSAAKVIVVEEEQTEEIPLRLPRELAQRLRATGPDWPVTAEKLLRAGLQRRKKIAA